MEPANKEDIKFTSYHFQDKTHLMTHMSDGILQWTLWPPPAATSTKQSIDEKYAVDVSGITEEPKYTVESVQADGTQMADITGRKPTTVEMETGNLPKVKTKLGTFSESQRWNQEDPKNSDRRGKKLRQPWHQTRL